LYPGIAVARELVARVPDALISFAGTARGIESRVVPREGFPLDLIRSSGIKGKSLVDRIRGAMLVPASLIDAWRVVSARHPKLVIGVGGYSSGPVVLVAVLRNIPTLLLEQNAVPGLTNRLLAPFARAIGVTFGSTQSFFGSKAFVSGNPVRPEFFTMSRTNPRSVADAGQQAGGSPVRILVFGGSQGAHAINVAMVEAAPRLASSGTPLRITHQTGEQDVDLVRSAYRPLERAGFEVVVEPFIYDMGKQLGESDLIVCRAGATTLAEIAAAGKPAILIPFPGATDDHQRKNAEAVAAAGGAEVLLQNGLTGEVLADTVVALMKEPGRREQMASATKRLAKPDAARVIVDRALELIRA
jgi:UDP-N-acetylglucosamine--N-acetylmuramyl-(pentapeptide) pyrophosphoryl-undecaprenol N-acetylglucosamine transferase